MAKSKDGFWRKLERRTVEQILRASNLRLSMATRRRKARRGRYQIHKKINHKDEFED